MHAAGYNVHIAHSTWIFPFRHFHLAWQFIRLASHVDAVWVTEGGHRLVPFLKLFTSMAGKPLIFDPFISRYNTRVEDRRWHSPNSLQAWVCKWQDWSSCSMANYLVFDTLDHQRYFFSRYGLKKPFSVLEIGADEAVFHPRVPPTSSPDNHMVLFFGTYIPLQGAETILNAASILTTNPGISFIMVGEGQEHQRILSLASEKKISNVRFENFEPPENLASRIAQADVCLGIFGDTLKASMVVPNKAVQCAAMGKAIISRRSTAMESYFTDSENILFVPAGDENALAAAILKLCKEPDMREILGTQARLVYERRFSNAAHAIKIQTIMDNVLARKKT
mgnify:FL=1